MLTSKPNYTHLGLPEIVGALLGSLLSGNPTFWGTVVYTHIYIYYVYIFGVPYRKTPLRLPLHDRQGASCDGCRAKKITAAPPHRAHGRLVWLGMFPPKY